ncbi:protein kinase [Micromonospora sp. NIE79]|uniref:non-specific serine/threonine protein kinase n=2 Tax=Micromonospora trifolii TaxID=2911208 RepID=A0ABS9N3A5_9ACTN|nr:protein kinase [Micromonospora trifolii]
MSRKPQRRSGEEIGGHVLVELLGSGGNAEVWRARGPSGGVAMKLVRARRGEPYARFQREVEQLRLLGDMPGILPYLDSHLPDEPTAKDPAWLTMPIAQPLRDALGPDPTAEVVVSAIAAITKTLASIHAIGVSHRDVKPDNLYMSDERWLIGDFGLVDAPNVEPLTEGAVNLGPRHYLAPEMILSPHTADGAAADVYSLGKTLWVLLTNQAFPLPGEHRLDVELFRLTTYSTHKGLASLERLLETMTRTDPRGRPSAERIADELTQWSAPRRTVATGADLSDFVRRAQEAVRYQLTEDERQANRKHRVEALMSKFAKEAEVVSRQCRASGLPVTAFYGGKYGDFDVDASDYLSENLGVLATTQVMGEDPPESRSAGLIIQVHEKAPMLKLWIGLAAIPRLDPEVILIAGSSIAYWGGRHRGLWSEQRRTVLGGPGERASVADLLDEMISRLPSDAEAWANALEEDSGRR